MKENENEGREIGREIARDVARGFVRSTELVPVRHLSLDLDDEPLVGWERALLERGVEIVPDDLGRPCVARSVLGDLLREERERRVRIAAESAERAAAVVAPARAGVPALEHGSPYEAMVAAGGVTTPAEEFGRGSVTRELMDQQFAESQRQRREEIAKRQALKAAQRLLEGK